MRLDSWIKSGISIEQFDLGANTLTILIMALVLLTKGLALRRQTNLGKSMARFNFVLAGAYFAVFLGIWWPEIFNSSAWRWAIRLLILTTASDVLRNLKAVYGGWRGLHREVMYSLLDICADSIFARCWNTFKNKFRKGDTREYD